MSDLNYTITKFDTATKILDVDFNDGSWARIQLSNPLPKNQTELESIIKDYASSVEAVQAQTAPDADLSFVESLVGNTYQTTRKSLRAEENQELDPEVAANAEMWEKIYFKQQVSDVLVELGLLEANPTNIPVSNG